MKQASIEDTSIQREPHVFAEASEDMIGAVPYLRWKAKEYSTDFTFVIGKCEIAQMRHLSIPRLESQAAVMEMRLKKQIVKELEMKINSCSFWSDSTTVLQWIHRSHRKQHDCCQSSFCNTGYN